jgi:CheY-like chemotaxis protein
VVAACNEEIRKTATAVATAVEKNKSSERKMIFMGTDSNQRYWQFSNFCAARQCSRYMAKKSSFGTLAIMPGILVVDDNPSIRHLLHVFVESKTNFRVCGEANHGADAIEKAKQLNPDLVLLDLSMPIINGAQAAVILKKTMPQTKIILFTMHADRIGEALADAVGVDLALSKTEGITNLDEHLSKLLST